MTDIKALKPRKCKSCQEVYIPARPLQQVCSPLCGIKAAQMIRIKTERKEHREKKLKMKSRSQWLKEAQAVFNKFVRLRDAEQPCISCQRYHAGQYHAGHYRTVGASPELRFNELNVHKQCAPCNNHLSGNIVNYRIGLIKKIGLDAVEFIEGKHEPLKLNIEEIKQLIAKYKTINKALEA